MTLNLMTVAAAVFWICASLISYTYFCYPAVLLIAYSITQLKRDLVYLTGRMDRRVGTARGDLPSVSILVPAHNEAAHLPGTLENLQKLDYPQDKLEIIIVSDGSTDGTNEILQNVQAPYIRTVLVPQRNGKASALNRAAAEATGSILLMSDASTLLRPDGVSKLTRHFGDQSVGAACGSLEFIGSDESKQTEGIYWKYESVLRLMEARLGATLTASGAYYALRRSCYQPLDPSAVLDDFLIPMSIRKQGFRIVYDPEAVAREFAEDSVSGEFRRRVRLAVGSFRALPGLIRTPMSVLTRVAFFSHKVSRWLMPFVFIGLLAANIPLIGKNAYGMAFALQCLFYLLAITGMISARRKVHLPGLLCYFLCAMNLAFLVGFFRALKGGTEGVWQRAN